MKETEGAAIMKRITLESISNINIPEKSRKLPTEVYEFIACLLSEYAIGYLGFDSTDNNLYPAICKYFIAGEISAKSLIEKLSAIPDIAILLNEFPDISSGNYFDHSQWNIFMSESEVIVDGSANHFLFNQHEYIIPQKLISFAEIDGEYYIQRLYILPNQKGEYRNIGIGDNPNPSSFSLADVQPHPHTTAHHSPDSIRISEDEFFQLDHTISAADPEQREAIRSDTDKNLVILAGAGSGKTRTLVCRLAYLHLVKAIPMNRILLLTFTTSAASEMKRRSAELIEPFYADRKLLDKPNVNARTIDSFVISLIDTYYAQMGFNQKPVKCLDGSEDSKRERLQMLEDTILDNKMQGVFNYYFDSNTNRANKKFPWLLSELLQYACGLPINCAGFDTLLTLYLNKQRECGKIMGFTEASLFVREAMQQPNSALANVISSRYSCILIDEFQDVNVLQNGIFEPLYDRNVHFTFVGDDDQSIYYWRGSDSSIVKKLLTKSNTHATYLLTNYRNNPNIVKAGNAVLRTIKDRAKKGKPIRPNRESGAKIRISTYDEKYTNLANEVSRLLAQGQEAEEICILSRNQADKELIIRALNAADIPVARERLQIDTDDNYKLMKAVLNILNENNITVSIKEIERISGVQNVTERHIHKVVLGQCRQFECEEELLPVKALSDELRQNTISCLADAVCRYSIKAAELFENIINDRHPDAVFCAFEDFCKNTDALWPVPQTQLREIFNTFEDDTRKENRRGGPLTNGVKVSTIHAAKGLEYNVVMITGLSDGKYPSTDQIDKVYSARRRQLQTLNESRETYYHMKATMIPEMYRNLLEACENPAYSHNEKEQLALFRDEIQHMQVSLLNLSADGVEEYLDSYRYYVHPLESQYSEDIAEQGKILLVKKTQAENIWDEILLLEQENSDITKARQQAYDDLCSELSIIERKIEKLKGRQLRFSKSIAALKEFYGSCLNASGLLADMEKADELEELYARIEEEKEQRINEERRLYYVAITRAKDILYLCHAAGTAPSEFIRIIDDNLKCDHVMLTFEEERECVRLTKALHEETGKAKVNESKVNEATDRLISFDKFKSYIEQVKESYYSQHPLFKTLKSNAKIYFEKAIGLLAVAELTGGEFKTEFAHNMQRMAETVLQNYSGSNAKPFKTSDFAVADQIVEDIRTISQCCSTGKPSPKYISKLITEFGPFSDELTTLKSAGIMHYIIRSAKYPISDEIVNSWSNCKPIEKPEEFLIASLDLANIRNALIHRESSKWPEDPIPKILENAEVILSHCFITPKALTSLDVRPDTRVQHKTFGDGFIKSVSNGSFVVQFDNGTAKTFMIQPTSSNFTVY